MKKLFKQHIFITYDFYKNYHWIPTAIFIILASIAIVHEKLYGLIPLTIFIPLILLLDSEKTSNKAMSWFSVIFFIFLLLILL